MLPVRVPVFLSTLLFAGCSLAPAYQRPAMPALPATFGAAAAPQAPTSSAPRATLTPAESQNLILFPAS